MTTALPPGRQRMRPRRRKAGGRLVLAAASLPAAMSGLAFVALLGGIGSSPVQAQALPPAGPGIGHDASRTDDALAPQSQTQATRSRPRPDAVDVPDTSVQFDLQANTGIYLNARPTSGRNFGQLFMDHANEPQLNTVALNISKPAAAAPGGYAVGFNFQAVYGSDARIATIVGITDRLIDARNQLAITQANVTAHLPWLTTEGVDVKAGILTGAMGLESSDPSARPFYSYSYLSNFLLPFEHVGVIATVNLGPHVSVLGQIDGGNSVSIGRGDPNRAPAGYFGVALNQIADGKLTVFATTRIGPEQSRTLFPNAARLMKYWNDVSIFYDPNDRLSVRLEANYQYDEALRASGYALMSFAIYKLTPEVSMSGRAEVYRDETGQLTVLLLDNRGYAQSLAGKPTRIIAAPPTTYGSLTAGLAIRPAAWQRSASVTIRPEVRYDRSLNGTRPFNDLKDRGAFMFGGDIIVGF